MPYRVYFADDALDALYDLFRTVRKVTVITFDGTNYAKYDKHFAQVKDGKLAIYPDRDFKLADQILMEFEDIERLYVYFTEANKE